ncbi:hypothetical protein E2C01_023339 [Portunus trituberculatus]|uniref:Uncharacterized protein n=1 Tax=Portunus trituberculatus TaxID=210409 RepID=A0A5B7EBB7_PORTR|nr:hypothetical protein [Portunus trituberculatus]
MFTAPQGTPHLWVEGQISSPQAVSPGSPDLSIPAPLPSSSDDDDCGGLTQKVYNLFQNSCPAERFPDRGHTANLRFLTGCIRFGSRGRYTLGRSQGAAFNSNIKVQWNHARFGVRGVSKLMGLNPVHGHSVGWASSLRATVS